MSETTTIDCICVKGDFDIDLSTFSEHITNDRYRIAIVGEVMALAKNDYDNSMFYNPTIRFYKDGNPFMVINREFDVRDVWEGFNKADIVEFSLDVASDLFSDLVIFSMYTPTNIAEDEQIVTRTIIGMFQDTPRAKQNKDKVMDLMLSTFINIIEKSSNEF